MTSEYDFTVILEPEPEGGFTVLVPALPEVVRYGENEAEALMMAREAIARNPPRSAFLFAVLLLKRIPLLVRRP
jgi:hypothetical protein